MVFRPAPPKWAWLLDTAAFPAAELSPVEQIFQPIPRRQSQTRAPLFFFSLHGSPFLAFGAAGTCNLPKH